MKVDVGQFVVERGAYDFELHRAVRVTGNTVYHSKAGGREGRIRMDAIVFVGNEQAASLLFGQLRSSRALCDDERMKSSIRHGRRVDALIAQYNKIHSNEGPQT